MFGPIYYTLISFILPSIIKTKMIITLNFQLSISVFCHSNEIKNIVSSASLFTLRVCVCV